MKIRIILPAAQAQAENVAAEEAVPVQRAPTNEYSETLRLPIAGIGTQTLTWRSGFTGTLEEVSIFNDNVDSGDYWRLSLNGRIIREKAYPVPNTALTELRSRPIEAGDTIVLTYYSQGITAKNIDFTPKVSYIGEGLG
jgi:hypothetical protein